MMTLLGRLGVADELPRDLRITRAVGFNVRSRRPKLVGKNSRLDVHGDSAVDRMLRLYTNLGVEAVGNCRADEAAVAKLLGENPLQSYQSDDEQMTTPIGSGTMPLWDLAGKVLKKPVYELLGAAGSNPVPVYDGSIYFADLLPEYEANWQDRFRTEIDMGMETGHRAFKVKIGRGNRWMERDEGDDRDVAVVETIRGHNAEILLGVDANNGYDLAGAKRCLQRIGGYNIAFAEEMFDETVEQCLEFIRFIRQSGWKTLLADGETQSKLEAFRPFIDAKAIEVLQGDMNRFGIDGIMTEAKWAGAQDLLVAPHNWGSLVGFYMQLHIGRAIANFFRAEHDTLTNNILVADGYNIREGYATVPDAPGFGISINEDKFATQAQINFDLRL